MTQAYHQQVAHRVTLLRITVVASLVLASCSRVGETSDTGGPRADSVRKSRSARPNVLLIITDDQRGGLTRRVMPSTRHRFVRRGVSFRNAFVTTPLCCPSRATILTGRYAHRNGVRRNEEGWRLHRNRMLQHRLRAHGYRTAYFGKFLNFWLHRPPPGFDRRATTGNDSYYNARWNVDGRVRTIPTYSTTYIRERATRFIRRTERKDHRPWFVVLAPSAPHGPQTPEARYAGASVPGWNGNPATRTVGLGGKPAYVRTQDDGFGEHRGVREAQLRTLMSVDDMVEATFGAMDRLNETRRTLAIFISDNGMLWGEFGLTGKTHAYTPSIRVPMMMRWPGHMPRGKFDWNLVTNADIAPTILHAAGLKTRVTDGRSLLRDPHRRKLLLEYWRSRPFPTPRWNSLRTKRFQYVEYYGRHGKITFREYFNLRRDPWQLQNLLHDGTRRNDPDVGHLSRWLRRHSDCAGRECP